MRVNVPVAVAISLLSVVLGLYVIAWTSPHDMVHHCTDVVQPPDNIDPLDVHGIGRDFEFLPLGLNCSWSVGPDGRNVQATPNWLPSILVYGGLAGAIGFPTAAYLAKLRRLEQLRLAAGDC